MKIFKLKTFTPNQLSTFNPYQKKVILYGDFNVLNLLYKTEYPQEFIIYPDSTLTFLSLRFLFLRKMTRMVSTDLQEKLLELFIAKNAKIAFFGDSDEVLRDINTMLIDKISEDKLLFISGYTYDSKEVLLSLNKFCPNLIFVGLGLSRQEAWLIENYKYLPSCLIISCGGWFQYLSGRKRRSPQFLRSIGLEWAHKMVFEFTRIWSRYLIMAPLFLYRIISRKIRLEVNPLS